MSAVPDRVTNRQMGTFWRGSDGNVWVSGDAGTNSAGKYDPNSAGYWDSLGYVQIADPNPQQSIESSPAPVGGGGGGSSSVFNQAAARNTQIAIDEIPGLLDGALKAEGNRYKNVTKGFDTQEAQQRAGYDQDTMSNINNYDRNMMASVRAGVKGFKNLMALLRGTGMEDRAREIVGEQTSEDIRTGYDTRTDNQAELDAVLSSFLTNLGTKRDEAKDTYENNQRAVNREYNTQLQNLYGKMAGFYSDVDNTGEANQWMTRAGNLTPKIADNSVSKVSLYDQTPVTVKAPEITAFKAPVDQAVGYADNSQLGSGIFSIGQRRKRETAPAGV